MMPILDISNLHVSFPSEQGLIQAVQDVNFHLNKGEIVGIVGESGCGKSVTAQSILGLLPASAHIQGEIKLNGENLLAKTDQDMQAIRGKKIGMVFQDPCSSLNPTMQIGPQLVEGMIKHENISKKSAYKKALALLEEVGINDASYRIHQYPHELSGGMRQRILIAISIACSPSLIIADEPTTALDATIQAQILELLRTIQQQYQTTILLITHDLGVVAHLCDRVIVMYGGRIMESGPVDLVFSAPKHPYTQLLLKAKRSLVASQGPLYHIPGAPPLLLKPPQQCLFAPRCPYAMRICYQQRPTLPEIKHPHQMSCWLNVKELT